MYLFSHQTDVQPEHFIPIIYDEILFLLGLLMALTLIVAALKGDLKHLTLLDGIGKWLNSIS